MSVFVFVCGVCFDDVLRFGEKFLSSDCVVYFATIEFVKERR